MNVVGMVGIVGMVKSAKMNVLNLIANNLAILILVASYVPDIGN
jgi:hypothetical protein